MTLRIGLTGGIGSGKSTVARIFEILGVPVFYADREARQIMNSQESLKKSILQYFGPGSYKEGVLNSSYLASIVFSDPAKLALLNSLVHPATRKEAERWMQQQTAPYAIHEAALLFEAGVQEQLDYVIGVSAPAELRLQRTCERDLISREEAMQRINSQLNEEEKMSRCDFIVFNDEQQLVIPQVLLLHEKLLTLAHAKTSS